MTQFVHLSGLIAELNALWSRHADLASSLEVIAEFGRSALHADGACVLLREFGELRVRAATGWRADSMRAAVLPSQVLEGSDALRHDGQQRLVEVLTGCDCVLLEPVAHGERAIGCLIFYRRDSDQDFDELERAEAAVLARQTGFTYSMQRRTRELELIYEVTRAINSTLKLEEVVEFIHEGIGRILPTDNLYIALYDEASEQISFAVEMEERNRLPKRSRPRGAGLTEYLLDTKRPLLIDHDFVSTCKGLGIRYGGRAAQCWMGAPMVSRDKALGVIALQSYEHEALFDRDDLSILENLAGQAAGAIENARLYQEACESQQQMQTAHQLLLQSEKLAAVGQLISGIAHELNNPLTAVVGWTQYLLGQPGSDPIRRQLSMINEQSQRASKIVQNLLTFSRQHKPEQTLVALRDIIESTLALRAYELRVNNIAVDRDYADGGGEPPLIYADPHQVQQVVLNLLINAEQAILSVRNHGRIRIALESQGGRVRLKIADDGPGIGPDLLKKIFDPFFTTKPIGQGTGLGLSISFGIVQEHGGNIWAENVPGAGAQFVVELPAPAAAETTRGSTSRSAEPPPPDQRRVLIVDDEETVRELLSVVLGNDPVHVETAASGEEALERASHVNFDLIVTDLKMPGLNGAQLWRRLRERCPELRSQFLFMTGDVLSPETRQFLDGTQSLCVLKPFQIEDARQTILQLLARAATA